MRYFFLLNIKHKKYLLHVYIMEGKKKKERAISWTVRRNDWKKENKTEREIERPKMTKI